MHKHLIIILGSTIGNLILGFQQNKIFIFRKNSFAFHSYGGTTSVYVCGYMQAMSMRTVGWGY